MLFKTEWGGRTIWHIRCDLCERVFKVPLGCNVEDKGEVIRAAISADWSILRQSDHFSAVCPDGRDGV